MAVLKTSNQGGTKPEASSPEEEPRADAEALSSPPSQPEGPRTNWSLGGGFGAWGIYNQAYGLNDVSPFMYVSAYVPLTKTLINNQPQFSVGMKGSVQWTLSENHYPLNYTETRSETIPAETPPPGTDDPNDTDNCPEFLEVGGGCNDDRFVDHTETWQEPISQDVSYGRFGFCIGAQVAVRTAEIDKWGVLFNGAFGFGGTIFADTAYVNDNKLEDFPRFNPTLEVEGEIALAAPYNAFEAGLKWAVGGSLVEVMGQATIGFYVATSPPGIKAASHDNSHRSETGPKISEKEIRDLQRLFDRQVVGKTTSGNALLDFTSYGLGRFYLIREEDKTYAITSSQSPDLIHCFSFKEAKERLLELYNSDAARKSTSSDNDKDKDGLSNTQDKCPNEAEDKDGFEDADGCPDPDNDKDGILDILDRCPNDLETVNHFEDENGCPDELPQPPPAEISRGDDSRRSSGLSLPTEKIFTPLDWAQKQIFQFKEEDGWTYSYTPLNASLTLQNLAPLLEDTTFQVGTSTRILPGANVIRIGEETPIMAINSAFELSYDVNVQVVRVDNPAPEEGEEDSLRGQVEAGTGTATIQDSLKKTIPAKAFKTVPVPDSSEAGDYIAYVKLTGRATDGEQKTLRYAFPYTVSNGADDSQILFPYINRGDNKKHIYEASSQNDTTDVIKLSLYATQSTNVTLNIGDEELGPYDLPANVNSEITITRDEVRKLQNNLGTWTGPIKVITTDKRVFELEPQITIRPFATKGAPAVKQPVQAQGAKQDKAPLPAPAKPPASPKKTDNSKGRSTPKDDPSSSDD